MGFTLKEKLEQRLKDMSNRINQLETNINTYIISGNLIDAAINKAKRDTLIMVYEDIKLLLNN